MFLLASIQNIFNRKLKQFSPVSAAIMSISQIPVFAYIPMIQQKMIIVSLINSIFPTLIQTSKLSSNHSKYVFINLDVKLLLQYKMISERPPRTKRSSYIINVVETPNGFSIVEGTELLNKPEGSATQQQSFQPSTQVHNHPLPPREYKPVFKKMNLVFLKKGGNLSEPQTEEQLQDTPQICKVFSQWFDLNKIHELQRREVVQWYSEKHCCNAQETEEREQLQQLLIAYRKDRNFIVNLYIKQFALQQKYLSASCIRKYLCSDALWLMKIHLYLTNLGVINTHSLNFALESKSRSHIFSIRPDGKRELLSHELSTSIETVKGEDQNELLKRLTSEIRPHCDFCRIHCGIVWFQHNRSLDPKEIANIMKNVNSKNPPLSQKQYQYILCVRCYCQAHFPLLLTHHDFKKICVNDRIQPGRKKRNKRRKREKLRRQGEEEGEEEPKDEGDDRSHQEQENREKKIEQVKAMISRLVNNVQIKQWTLQETDFLLELVEKYEEDWSTIHEEMNKKGYCQNMETEQIIFYFLSLPRRNVCRLQQQYSEDQFIQSNYTGNKTNILDKLSQHKLNDSIRYTASVGSSLLKQLTQQAEKKDYLWKQRVEDIIRLSVAKYQMRLQHLQTCQSLVKSLKVFSDG